MAAGGTSQYERRLTNPIDICSDEEVPVPMLRLTTPRIAPLPLAAWDPELRARFERPGGLGQILHVMATLAHHPDLFRRWGIFANHLLFKSTLTLRSREIVILRTAWLAGCAYEWGQHLKIAESDVAFGEAEFTALAEGAAAALWGPAEAALIQAADGFYRDAFVDDVTWNMLVAHYDQRQILDILFTVSNDVMLAMGINTFYAAGCPFSLTCYTSRPYQHATAKCSFSVLDACVAQNINGPSMCRSPSALASAPKRYAGSPLVRVQQSGPMLMIGLYSERLTNSTATPCSMMPHGRRWRSVTLLSNSWMLSSR